MTEFGIVMEPSPGNTAPLAEKIEQLGFDILLSPDTQNLSPDPIGQLNLAGARTTTLRLGTGVTNPITRDPAVLASSLALTFSRNWRPRPMRHWTRRFQSGAHWKRQRLYRTAENLYREASRVSKWRDR
jgi:hypothetical protein